MVNVSRRGFHDWVVQRATAVIVGLYLIFLVGFVGLHYPVDYVNWHQLFSTTGMKVATIIVMLSVIWHAWIGLWTVFTDYVHHCAIRLLLEILVVIALVGYVVWCVDILYK